MKRILFLAFLIPSIAWAQPAFLAKSTPAATSCNASQPGKACSATVDAAGTQYVTSGTSASSLGKAEDAASASGDTIVVAGVQRADTEGDTTSTDGDYATLHETQGRLSVMQRDRISSGTIDTSSTSNTFGPVSCEGMGSYEISYTRTAETGNLIAQVAGNNGSYTQDSNIFRVTGNYAEGASEGTLSAGGIAMALTNGSASYRGSCAGMTNVRVKVSSAGAGTLPITITTKPATSIQTIAGIIPGYSADALGKQEDAAHASGDVGVMCMGVLNTGVIFSRAGSTGDYVPPQYDAVGRLAVNSYGEQEAQFFQSCSSAVTDTSDSAIKAAVASNRMYIRDISCTNTAAAVSSAITFKDGSTAMFTGYVSSTALGMSNWHHSFAIPLRGSVNTAFNFAMGTTSSSTTCCATGYISTN